ncbi:uncharacterized protein METZ01_LOCUS299035, partial [marine metagenome]
KNVIPLTPEPTLAGRVEMNKPE